MTPEIAAGLIAIGIAAGIYLWLKTHGPDDDDYDDPRGWGI